MEKAHKNNPLYIGIFAQDPKTSHKTIRNICKETLLSILQHTKPEEYLQTNEKIEKQLQKQELECLLNEDDLLLIEKDYINFQNFNSPKDNYHITSLFLGKNKDKLKKGDKELLSNWKNGVKEIIKIDFIVYVPNHLMTGFALQSQKVQVSNQFPHMTLLLKEKASAVESNAVLTTLHAKMPQIFQKRNKKITILNIPYSNISKYMIVIDMKFQIEGITGDNCNLGKK